MCVYAVIKDVSCKNKFFFFFMLFFLEMLFNDMKFPAIPKTMFPAQWNSCSKFHLGKDANQWNVRSLLPFLVLFLSVSLFFCSMFHVQWSNKALLIALFVQFVYWIGCSNNRQHVCTWVIDELNRYKHKRKDYLKVYTTLDWGIKLQVTHWGTVGLVL